MHIMIDAQFALSASSRALRDLILAALNKPQPVSLGGNTGLSAGAVDCLSQNLVIATSPVAS